MAAQLLSVLILLAATPSTIHRTFTRKADLTGDGKPERVIVTIEGASWDQPFTWSVSVRDGKKEIFRHSQTDTRIDSFFRDPGFVDHCSGYRACKERYYFRDLPNTVIGRLTPSEISNIADKTAPNGVYVEAREDLQKCCSTDPAALDRAVEELANLLRSGHVWILQIPVSPVQGYPPLGWSATFRRFVRIYEE